MHWRCSSKDERQSLWFWQYSKNTRGETGGRQLPDTRRALGTNCLTGAWGQVARSGGRAVRAHTSPDLLPSAGLMQSISARLLRSTGHQLRPGFGGNPHRRPLSRSARQLGRALTAREGRYCIVLILWNQVRKSIGYTISDTDKKNEIRGIRLGTNVILWTLY